MRCIFCKHDSSSSKSREHILPESIGNKSHVLPVGAVCDGCNNYFARKIEGPLLNTLRFRNLRGRQLLGNKRGVVPTQTGILAGTSVEVDLWRVGLDDIWHLAARHDADAPLFLERLLKSGNGTIYIPDEARIDQRLMSRFLAKVGLEVLAERVMKIDGWNEEIVNKEELDEVRRYARYNEGLEWPFYERRIYGENQLFNGDRQVVHEFTLLATSKTQPTELYSIICIFGVEYAINLGGPEIEGYEQWLKMNANCSPLY